MYCPKCSQQQISEEVRFCSRCGFSLTPVRELIVTEALAELAAPAGQPSCGQKGARRGAWMMLASLALTLIVGLLSAVDDDFAFFLILPFFVFVIGFLIMIYGVFFADKRAARKKEKKEKLSAATRSRELPPSRVAPIENYTAPRVQTAEMIRPPSVTENTTRLLEEESDLRREGLHRK